MKPYKIAFIALSSICFWMIIIMNACFLRIPKIKGVVLDEETGKPVKEAGVNEYAGIEHISPQGDVGGDWPISKPHTRTGEDGEFVISKISWSPLRWLFLIKVKSIKIYVETINKEGEIVFKAPKLRKK